MKPNIYRESKNFEVPIKKYPSHNFVYIEPIVTTQGNYSHGPKVIPTTPKLKSIVAEFDVKVLTYI
jgi:hypothetical protein